jgi:probable H4MPT-linked C1 transfer pathway protein
LCDCFATKREGVAAVLGAVAAAVPDLPIRVWLTDGRFVSLDTAREKPLLAAASNWAATATLAARLIPAGPAVLIDVGSTTTDIIPLLDGKPAARGRTDPERLHVGELVYTGAMRTPVAAVVRSVPWRGAATPVAGESFATTLDVHLALGNLPERPEWRFTADGRPATLANARARLARVICADAEMLNEAEVVAIARAVADAQVADLRAAYAKAVSALPAPPKAALLAGGAFEFLATAALPAGIETVSLTGAWKTDAQVAPAFAVAVLAAEERG